MCPFVRYMLILARCFFSSARLRFDSKILLLRARGRGDFRRRAFSLAAISCARRVASACSTASSHRPRASLRFWAWERDSCTLPPLPHDRKKLFDHTRTAECSGGDAANSDHLVDVLLQIHVERVLQQSGVAMIVFRGHEDKAVATLDSC